VVAQFLARRVKWPEGVETPFDGYRAYRLYAVKKAMEERPGRRLVRYDGWAGHAELLRAVLPFARRVDVVNVDDRADRLQRPRREKPFAAAMQVRGLGSTLEPEGLVGVEELDRIAATASRSRERAALSVRVGENGRNARNGGRTARQERPASRQRGQGGPERTSPRSETERSPRKRERLRDAGRPERSARGGRPERSAPAARRQQETGAAPVPAEESTLETAPDATTLPAATIAGEAEQNGTPAADSKPKRKRRRRRRTSGRADGGTAAETPNDVPAAPDDAEPSAESAVEVSGTEVMSAEGEVQKKRRRRGGRRGGRGRRKPSSAEAGTGEAPPEFMPDAAAESAAHVESD
jgi:hypothetical protein